MTKEYFFAYKAQLEKCMVANLEHSKVVGYPLKPYCTANSIETITIASEEEEAELRHLMSRVNELMTRENTVMDMTGDTYSSGRYDYFNTVSYHFTTIVVKDEIEPHQVEEVMKLYVKKQLNLRSNEYLECKVMQLFKDGLIEWAEVQEAHKTEECTL